MNVEDFSTAYAGHHADCEAIAGLLEQSGDSVAARRAQRMRACGTWTAGYLCPECGEFHVTRTSLCRDRLCPNCNWALAKRRYHDALNALTAIHRAVSARTSHLVLTVKHDAESDLRALLWTLTRGYGALLRDPTFSGTLGTMRAVELTHGDNGFHPHIHALVVEDEDTRPVTQEAAASAWRAAICADYDPQVSFEAAYSATGDGGLMDAVGEACKYAIKPGVWAGLDAGSLMVASDALRGVRMTASSGIVRAQLARERATRDEAVRPGHCSDCFSDARPEWLSLRWNHVDRALERE